MQKGDVEYTTHVVESNYLATVKMVCLDGQEFVGELAGTEKEAQQSAAHVALIGLSAEVSAKSVGKRPNLDVYVDGSSMKLRKTTPTGEDDPGMFMKERLREVVKQIVGRDLIESDVSYEYSAAPSGGHVYTVSIPALPDGSSKKVWVGAISPFKRDAQLIAAQAAYTDLCNDPLFGPHIDKFKLDEMDKRRLAKKEAKTAEAKAKAEPVREYTINRIYEVGEDAEDEYPDPESAEITVGEKLRTIIQRVKKNNVQERCTCFGGEDEDQDSRPIDGMEPEKKEMKGN